MYTAFIVYFIVRTYCVTTSDVKLSQNEKKLATYLPAGMAEFRSVILCMVVITLLLICLHSLYNCCLFVSDTCCCGGSLSWCGHQENLHSLRYVLNSLTIIMMYKLHIFA